MHKIIALLVLVVVLCAIGGGRDVYLKSQDGKAQFATSYNLGNVAKRAALLSIYAVGVGMVIITGGIDLSLGSLIAFTGYLTTWFLADLGWPSPAVFLTIGALGITVGLCHGVLVSYARLPPFVVTLCGLLIYRGLARVVSDDHSGAIHDSFEFVRFLTKGSFIGVPMPVWLALCVAIAGHVFLSYTIWGRYIYALGNNEEATLYSGINVRFTKILTYMICSLLGAFSGILEASDVGSITPSTTGTFYELYAIAAAVLGGCSLRGGEGTVLGIILGAVAIRLIENVNRLMKIDSKWDYFVLGVVILAGAVMDSFLEAYRSRRLARRRT